VARDLGGHLPFDLKERVVAVSADEQAKDVLDARQRPPAQFQCGDGVAEIRRFGPGGDGLDLRLVLRKRAGVGGGKVLGPDQRERLALRPGSSNVRKMDYRCDAGGSSASVPCEVCELYIGVLRLEVGPRFGESAAALEAP
jgi:hypothetical protein